MLAAERAEAIKAAVVMEQDEVDQDLLAPTVNPRLMTFIRLDLFGIQEEVADRFDDLPVESSAPNIRMLVLGRLVSHQFRKRCLS